MGIVEDEPTGPGFTIVHEDFADDCHMPTAPDESGCDPIIGMTFASYPEGYNDGLMHPATLVCRGLREMTEAEAQHAALMQRPSPTGKICDLSICPLAQKLTEA